MLPPKLGLQPLTSFVFQNLLEQRAHSAQPPVPSKAQVMARSLTVAAQAQDRKLDDDYDLREELGSGSLGKVYRAVDRRTGEHWAVKIVSTRQFSMDKSFSLDELLGEARMLRTVSHPAIVSVRDAYSSPEAFAIVMQLVEGGDLFDRVVRKGSYPEAAARGLLRAVLGALSYLHARGIVHRDIKPENILLRRRDDDVDALLTDFGLAKHAGSLACSTFCGTPQYLAPEVMDQQNAPQGTASTARLRDRGYDGAAADIWSLGICLYVLLSGSQPANSRLDRKSEACKFDAPIWATISDDAKQVIRKMTAILPSKRPTAVRTILTWRGRESLLRVLNPPPPPFL